MMYPTFRKDVLGSDPFSLARLMMFSELLDVQYSSSELAAMLREVFAVDLDSEELLQLDVNSGSLVRAQAHMQAGDVRTMGEAVLGCAASIELLNAIKIFGKQCSLNSECALPQEVACVLYYTAIAAALVRFDESISTLSARDLGSGLQWVLKRDWLDDRIRELIHCAYMQTTRLVNGSESEGEGGGDG